MTARKILRNTPFPKLHKSTFPFNSGSATYGALTYGSSGGSNQTFIAIDNGTTPAIASVPATNVVRIVGLAVPVVTPTSLAVKNCTLGTKPNPPHHQPQRPAVSQRRVPHDHRSFIAVIVGVILDKTPPQPPRLTTRTVVPDLDLTPIP